MIVRSKAPLRLGLAGGGSDVSPYSDDYGGCVLNVTIDMYAYTTIEHQPEGKLEFFARDLGQSYRCDADEQPELNGELILHKAVHNRVVKEFFRGIPLPVRVTTYSDAPPGSGLGTSSTLVVSILSAYKEFLTLPLGDYDLARMAFEIERVDCGLSGGKQDQYAATFGGVNFMEFYANDKVIINPLRIRDPIINELNARQLLYYTGQSRESARIIDDQIRAVKSTETKSLESMHEVKRIAYEMKELLLKNRLDEVVDLFRASWAAKKQMAASISNSNIDLAANAALDAGAKAVKISGAGGGGYMMIFIDPTRKHEIVKALSQMGGHFVRCSYTQHGVQSWAL